MNNIKNLRTRTCQYWPSPPSFFESTIYNAGLNRSPRVELQTKAALQLRLPKPIPPPKSPFREAARRAEPIMPGEARREAVRWAP